MQRFAGLNSIEGWNLTLQLSYKMEDENRIKKLLTNVDERDILIKLICKTEMSNVKKAKNKFKKVVDKRLRI